MGQCGQGLAIKRKKLWYNLSHSLTYLLTYSFIHSFIGALVGRNKKQCVEQYGKDQVKRWRRSWDEPPPPMSKTSEFYPYNDRRYSYSFSLLHTYLPTHAYM